MNALELANILEKCVLDGSTNLVCVYDAVIMLRYLQAQIDTHKEQNSSQIDTHRYEPVAWMNKWGSTSFRKTPEFTTPLYTHPADLTDEEIENIEHKVYLSTIAKGKPLGSYSKALVKEIIRKANEK